MAHPRVDQLRFARSEWQRGLRGLGEADARRRVTPMNSISWIAGHLAAHERRLWVMRGLGLEMEPVLDAVASGAPAVTPPLRSMTAAWRRIVAVADPFLDELTTETLAIPLPHDTRRGAPTAGTEIQRITYHYWSHIGEASAVRQILGHQGLAEFVGDLDGLAPYRPED